MSMCYVGYTIFQWAVIIALEAIYVGENDNNLTYALGIFHC